MKDTQKRDGHWGEGRIIAAALCVLALACVLTALNRLPQKIAVEPVHAVEADLYDAVLIDLNSASAERLMRLEGIGEMLAERIIAGRPYGCADDLLRVDGIGEGILEEIRHLVKCG